MTRIEPTLGDLEDLFNDHHLHVALTDVQDLATAHVDVTAEALQQAREQGQTDLIAQAEAAHLRALDTSRRALEALADAIDGRRRLVEGHQAYLQENPERGAGLFERASDLFRRSAHKASEVGFALADWPEDTWKKVNQRVDNAVTRLVEDAEAGYQVRKARVQTWFQTLSQRIETFADRVQAIPGQIQARITATRESVKLAALNVIIPALKWGVSQEEQLRVKARNVADVGEAVVKTAIDAGRITGVGVRKALGEVVRAAEKGTGRMTQAFDQHLAEARARNRNRTP